jgi:ATP-dependent helicase HrpB
MQPLPIDSLLPGIVESLRDSPRLVIEAPPGAGKTTRIPPAILDSGLAAGGDILILEPRRIAARLAARQVAFERGESPGESVGYEVRFEKATGARTRLKYVTEGILMRRLLSDPQLEQVSVVILDEFHERHLEADFALALLKRLQQESRPDIRIVAMSATLNAEPIARFLGDCRVLRSEGRRFEVTIEHLTRPDDRPLAAQVEGAASRLLEEGLDGDVLVFLPGAAEIRRAAEACAPLAAEFDLLVLPLHGELSLAEQDRAVRPAERRKVILSTNVAESSVTIEGVVAVVDSGLARIAQHSPWSGLPAFSVTRISRASAVQRAGRAGRMRPGRALRLYTAQDFAARADYEVPEILRADLASAALELHALGITDLNRLDWFEAPPAHALEQADTLLMKLGALDDERKVTANGRRMLQLPLHPRLSRLVIEAGARGVERAACTVAALLSERDIRARQLLSKSPGVETRARAGVHGKSDLLDLLDLFTEAAEQGFNAASLRRLELNPKAVENVERVRRQLERLLGAGKDTRKPGIDQETELLISILAGYPDRVARRRKLSDKAPGDNLELALAGGGSATLVAESLVRAEEFLVAVDAEERRGKGITRGTSTVVRLASAIEPEWLLDLFAERIRETSHVEWNAQSERVETVNRLIYEELTLDESRKSVAGGEAVTGVLVEAALSAGFEDLIDREMVSRFLARVDVTRQACPELDLPNLDEEDVRASVAALCEGRSSFSELCEAVRGGLLEVLRARLTPEQARTLARMAPERAALARGRMARINYERHKSPWIASRLQDFFGMKEAPRIAGGRVPLVLHLLAPNGRAVQVTTDLHGFWLRHYAQLRRELGRRYPRHAWPEDPLAPL